MEPIAGKISLVTGATRGIGRAVARMLSQEGSAVAICARGEDAVGRAAAELRAETGGKVAGKAADVRNYDDVARLFQFIDREFGGLDILVNNAGVGAFGSISDLSVEDWKRTLETNLDGVFYCTQAALQRMETRGGGFIVNMSSLAGKNPFAGGAAYNASKFALNGFSEAVMLDKRHDHVRVSYIMPGSVATGFGGPSHGEDWKISPDDIAEIVRTVLRMPQRTLISRVEVRPSTPPGAKK